MARFLVRRILFAIGVLILISIITYGIFFWLSPDPAVTICGKACTPSTIATIRQQLGLDKPFLAEVSGVVVEQFAHHHPELRDRQRQIARVLTHEEESFGRTIAAGIGRFQALVEELARTAAADGETVAQALPGREVFRLYDTYGFPFDLTQELAREHHAEVRRTINKASALDCIYDNTSVRT